MEQIIGSVWEECLKVFWEDSSLTLKAISQRLGVRIKTVLRQADRLKLIFPRPNTKARATELCSSLKPCVFSFIQAPDILESCRKQWLEVIAANAEAGRTQLRSKAPAIYGQLYKHDKNWLLEHLPPPLTNNGTLYVDWNNRDIETLEAVKVSAQCLKQDVNRPIWISRTAIANFLDHPASAWVKRHLNRLPMTAKVLDELAETREEFAVRRVQWAANTFHQENITPHEWQLVRRASLRKETKKLPLVKKAIAAALKVLNSLN